jgi:dephospho-CoA kinase
MLRRGMTAAKAESIIKNQLPEEEKISRSQYHVINDGDTLVLPQVLNIHAALVTPENN